MGLRQSYWGQVDSFGVPLPTWLHKYPHGLELDMDFCSFVSDWHEVLASRPDTLDLCVPLSTMNSKLGGDHFPQSERVCVCISKNKLDLDNVSTLHLSRIFLSQGKLFAELIYSCRDEPAGRFHYQRVSIFSKSSKFRAALLQALQSQMWIGEKPTLQFRTRPQKCACWSLSMGQHPMSSELWIAMSRRLKRRPLCWTFDRMSNGELNGVKAK